MLLNLKRRILAQIIQRPSMRIFVDITAGFVNSSEQKVAEVHGNRTRLRRISPHIGFEDRGRPRRHVLPTIDIKLPKID